MGMDTLPCLVLGNFKSWGSVTSCFYKLLRAKRPTILIKYRKIFKVGQESHYPFAKVQNAQQV